MNTRSGLSASGLRGAVAVLLLALAGCASGTASPTSGKMYEASVARLAVAEWASPTVFLMTDLRDWDYDRDGATRRDWRSQRFDIGDVRSIWFQYTAFDFSDTLGHTFLTFELERNGRPDFLTVSIEARKEADEDYSPWRGIFGEYELAWVWSTEKDLLTKIAIQDRGTRMYRVNIEPEKAGLILKGFIERSNRVWTNPEVYNTLQTNCATELADVVNDVFGQRIPYDSSFVLTGRTAEYLHSLGYIGDPDERFKTIKARAEVGHLVNANQNLPERQFSVALRRALAAQQ